MRKSGYLVSVQVFVPVNPKDLNDPSRKAALVQQAIAGDLGPLVAQPDRVITKVDYRFTSKDVGGAPVEDARQTDIEDAPNDDHMADHDDAAEDAAVIVDADEELAQQTAQNMRRRARG